MGSSLVNNRSVNNAVIQGNTTDNFSLTKGKVCEYIQDTERTKQAYHIFDTCLPHANEPHERLFTTARCKQTKKGSYCE